MTAWRDTMEKFGVRMTPGAGGLLAWWQRSLMAWLPPRWQLQLGWSQARLLLWRDGEQLLVARQLGAELGAPLALPWPLSPADLDAVLGPRLAALPRAWLLPAHSALQRTLRLPAAAADHLRDVVRFEIDRQTPFQADQVVYDVRLGARRDDAQLDAELVVAPRRVLEDLHASAGALRPTLAGVDVAGADGAPLGVNLLPPEQRYRRADPMRRWNAILAATALLALFAAGWQLLDNRRDALEQLRAQVDNGAQRARGVAAQRQQLVDLVEGAAFFDQLRAERPTSLEIWNELSKRLPEGTYLEKFSVEGDQLQLIGLSSEASSLVGRLEGSPLWRTPSLTGVLQADPGSHRDRFTLTAELAGTKRKEAADAGAGR
ncbi:PilN domain-containing protein [Xanthomonas sp. NCPPB 2654]|uniref:PilN domain-containing protein n=1 Tax=unclassified Xanthomonas TaxID=2643310 RepID=UPI0021E0315F|nr:MULTISPECIES: PilN domain-containing protein [unclassified Xanthomonas]MDL5365104.1 PilN domain-containing protein [Xanthomonas sp. NCPPB 2654]UYC21527.1 PilN domain-containing protein [Xanthomonas sp. CFBP 8443]